jgi:hypothetical protein
MDWATERSDPIKEYLEFEDHPLVIRGNTMKEVIQEKRRMEKFDVDT